MVAPFVSREKRTTPPLLQEHSEGRNTTNTITDTRMGNFSQRSPNHWGNAGKNGMNGFLKNKSNKDGRFFRPTSFYSEPERSKKKQKTEI
ncbi:hypothetical protein DSECCO2_602740 [anaerobic digester metagenome]